MVSGSPQEGHARHIRAYVFENFVMTGVPEDVPLDESLVDLEILDSFGIVELATWVESEFKITIADDEIVRENFGSISRIAGFALRKQGIASGIESQSGT